jgi:hypothetical protein
LWRERVEKFVALLGRERWEQWHDVFGVGAADEVDGVEEGFGGRERGDFVESWFGEESPGVGGLVECTRCLCDQGSGEVQRQRCIVSLRKRCMRR